MRIALAFFCVLMAAVACAQGRDYGVVWFGGLSLFFPLWKITHLLQQLKAKNNQ
jgi:hypothetical protein